MSAPPAGPEAAVRPPLPGAAGRLAPTASGGARPAAPSSARGRAARWAGWTVAAGVPLAFLGLFFGWPAATLVARGFTTDGVVDLTGFVEVFGRARTARIVGQTLAQAGLGTLLSLLLGLPGAYVLHRCRFRGRALVRAFVTVPFVLPTVVVGVAFRTLLVDGGPLGFLDADGTFGAIVAALVFFNIAVVVRTVGGLWERLDPRAEQAARALGASPARAFVAVTLPALGPAIASAASLVFLFCATAFGTVLVLGGPGFGTVETEIWVQTTQFLDLRTASVLSVVQLVLVAAALAVAGRARARAERALHLAGDDRSVPLRWRTAGWGTRAAVLVTAGVVAGLALPVVTLVARSLRTPTGWGLDHYAALGTVGSGLSVTVWDAAANSLRAAVDATVLAVVVGGLVAFVVSRRPRGRSGRRAVRLLDAVFMLPLGVSAVTVGFGVLLTFDRPLGLPVDLRTGGLLVPVAQAVVAVPLVVRTVLPVLRAIDPRLREAAAALGATPARVLAAVDLPIAARAAGLAVGFAFAVSLGEFGATSFLARPDRPTLPVVIFRLIGRPGAESAGMALAACVVLAAMTAAVIALAERLRAPGQGGLL